MQKRLTRQEVPERLTWDLRDIFPSEQAWATELASLNADLPQITRFRGKLATGAGQLFDCLEALETLQGRMIRVRAYAQLNQSADGISPVHQVNMGKAAAVGAVFQAETAFIRSEIMALSDDLLTQYYAELPKLREFQRRIELTLAQKGYQLNPETEKALASLAEVLGAPSLIYNRSKAADMSFEPVQDRQGNSHPQSFSLHEEKYERSPDPVLRHNAWHSFSQGLKAYQNTYGAAWGTEVKKQVVLARLRGYDSATHMLLHGQEVSLEAYNNLHDIILQELAPHMRRYARLRKQVLGLDKLLYCDIEAPLDPEFAPPATFEAAKEIILNGLAVLGSEYTEIMAQGLNNRWIDLADNVGKSTGAFCSSVYQVHPYILVTWADSMRNVLILSHELGHGGHGVLSQRYQRLSNSWGSMFFVEAPSIINELLVANYIRSTTEDPRMHRWLNMQLLTTYHHNYVRHLIEGELQRRIFILAEKGQPVTAPLLSHVQGEILAEFWGDEVEIDEGARLTWMRQPHYYMGLYPYSYSAGLTIGTAVAKAIREQGQPVVDRWLEVLKAGGTKSPLELANMAGVDMANPDAIRKAVDYVGELVDQVVASFPS